MVLNITLLISYIDQAMDREGRDRLADGGGLEKSLWRDPLAGLCVLHPVPLRPNDLVLVHHGHAHARHPVVLHALAYGITSLLFSLYTKPDLDPLDPAAVAAGDLRREGRGQSDHPQEGGRTDPACSHGPSVIAAGLLCFSNHPRR